MKQSLQLKIGQQLTMTPQLQQAIRLLQLSTLELQTEIQQALDSNLMLEAEEGHAETSAEGEADNADADDRLENATAADSEAPAPTAADDREVGGSEGLNDTIPDELATDSGWDDVYDSGSTSYSAPAPGDDRDPFETLNVSGEDLREHLQWQREMGNFSALDVLIADAIIDAVNDDGYLSLTLEEIHAGLLAQGQELGLDEVEAVLHRVQSFDPVGVAARDLGECLSLQLRALPPSTPWRREALRLTQQYLHLLGSRDFSQIMRRMKLDSEALQSVIALIQSLNPRPGGSVASKTAEYVVPDVYVAKRDGRWWVDLNPEALPRVRINATYAGMVRRADNSADNTYLRNHLQEARWFIKSLQSRNETLLKVARCIVEQQQGFFEQGEESMRPLVLRDVAEAVEMHESTISRVTNQKYMHTPRGIFEFKYFFSSHVATSDGGEASSTAIRAMIRKLIADEPATKPYSDSRIAALLGEQGIQVARRTVAKYREAMHIPPSNERKRLA